jgi:hypothetical protein
MKRRQASPSRDGHSERPTSPSRDGRKSQWSWDDPAAAEAIARRTGHDVEKVRASLAGLKQLIQDIKSDQSYRKIEDPERAGPPKDWRDYRKFLAANIKYEHAALADQLRRGGEPNPRTRAWEMLAPKYKKSAYALRRFVERNSRARHKISR